MGSYSSSEATRMAFIMAAGELFAEHSVKAVSLREISQKAGENMGNIHYNFGGKDGLLNAVVEYAMSSWKDDPCGQYLNTNRALLASRDGQMEVLSGMIDLFFKLVFANDRPQWCGTLMLQIIQRNLPVAQYIFENGRNPLLRAFSELYRTISGDNDIENALCWIVIVTAPAHVFSREKPNHMKHQFCLETDPEKMRQKLRDMTVRAAMANLNPENRQSHQ